MTRERNMRRVLFLNPAPPRIVQGGWYRMPLLGLGYLASYAGYKGYPCSIVDAKFERLGTADILDRITGFNPHLLAVTAMTHEINRASELAGLAKGRLPGVKCVIGGPHATALPVETLEQFPAFDFSVFGEGEETFAELLQAVDEGREPEGIKGLAFRGDGGAVRRNEPRPWNLNIDELPFPAWDLYPPARYYQLFSSRGCPYRCSFCMRVLGERVRYRSPENVVDEFEWVVRSYRPLEVSFSDEVFTLDEERARRICDMIIERGLNRTSWFANARANCLSPALYRKMREAGCTRVGIGIESGNRDILKNIRKNIKLDQAREVVKMARSAGLRVAAFFIIGHPFETEETIRDTVSFAREINPSEVAFGIMVPYPGTEIAAMAGRGEGGYRVISRDWRDYDKYFGSALELEKLSRADLERWQVRAYLTFYLGNFRILSLLKFLSSRRSGVLHFLRRLLWKKR